MKKTIETEGRTLELCANAATPVRFKMIFGEDLLTEIAKVKDNEGDISLTSAKLAYIMTKQNDGTINDASPDDFILWLEGFEDPMFFVETTVDIIEFYTQNLKTTSKPKNPKGPRTGK